MSMQLRGEGWRKLRAKMPILTSLQAGSEGKTAGKALATADSLGFDTVEAEFAGGALGAEAIGEVDGGAGSGSCGG